MGPPEGREGGLAARRRRGRRPSLVGEGTEPDPRFTFANERTFLAWNRTALGTMVAGLAISHVLAPEDAGQWPKLAGIALMAVSAALSVAAYFNWERAERALRRREALPHSLLLPVLSGVVALVAALAAVMTTVAG